MALAGIDLIKARYERDFVTIQGKIGVPAVPELPYSGTLIEEAPLS
jgi:hypothetical protein